MFINKLPKIHQKYQTSETALKIINVLMETGSITKTSTLVMTFKNCGGGKSLYFRFGYDLLTICNHTQGQVSVSMNMDPINIIRTSQQSTK